MGSAAYRTASIRRPRASTPVSGSARRRSQFEVRVWACRDARRRRRSSGRVRLTEFQQHVGGQFGIVRAMWPLMDRVLTGPRGRSGYRRRHGTAGRVAGVARRRRRPRGTSCESLAFLFAATGARRVRRPDHVVVAIGFTAAGGGLLLRRRCRRATRRVLRGGRLVVSSLSLWVTPRRRENGVGSPADADTLLGRGAR